jgi:hypothetical protein
VRSPALTREAIDIRIRLVDEAYTSWWIAECHCADALRGWLDAGPHDRAGANLAYRAALDREEAAARDFERLSALARP